MNKLFIVLAVLVAIAQAGKMGSMGGAAGYGAPEPAPEVMVEPVTEAAATDDTAAVEETETVTETETEEVADDTVDTAVVEEAGECADVDTTLNCCFWASMGECEANTLYMAANCAKSCGTCDCTETDKSACATSVSADCTLGDGQKSLPDDGDSDPAPGDDASGDCADVARDCCAWQALGECNSNPFWMRVNCQKACGTCGCTLDQALTGDACQPNSTPSGCAAVEETTETEDVVEEPEEESEESVEEEEPVAEEMSMSSEESEEPAPEEMSMSSESSEESMSMEKMDGYGKDMMKPMGDKKQMGAGDVKPEPEAEPEKMAQTGYRQRHH